VRRPTLLRYYGLSALLVLAIVIESLLGIIARGYELEWLLEWGFKGIGALCAGLCCLLRGLDFIVLCRRYPPFLRENAPQWESYAHRVSPGALLYMGVVFTLGGAMQIYVGGRNLVFVGLEGLP
jgi:hypothetical protein